MQNDGSDRGDRQQPQRSRKPVDAIGQTDDGRRADDEDVVPPTAARSESKPSPSGWGTSSAKEDCRREAEQCHGPTTASVYAAAVAPTTSRRGQRHVVGVRHHPGGGRADGSPPVQRQRHGSRQAVARHRQQKRQAMLAATVTTDRVRPRVRLAVGRTKRADTSVGWLFVQNSVTMPARGRCHEVCHCLKGHLPCRVLAQRKAGTCLARAQNRPHAVPKFLKNLCARRRVPAAHHYMSWPVSRYRHLVGGSHGDHAVRSQADSAPRGPANRAYRTRGLQFLKSPREWVFGPSRRKT